MNMKNKAHGIFATPVYMAKRESAPSVEEEHDIDEILKERLNINVGNFNSSDQYVLNSRLKEIKQFCDKQILGYIEEIIYPQKEDIQMYITQSWLNLTKPGGFHHVHNHSNSILSGVFYISTQEGDSICFIDPNADIKNTIVFEYKDWNQWNSVTTYFPVSEGELVIFPSWLRHSVPPNENATKDRISLSFNTFVRGKLYHGSESSTGAW